MKNHSILTLALVVLGLASAARGGTNPAVAVWSAQTDTTPWNDALGLKYTRQGCSDTPAQCMSLIKSVATGLNVKATLHIPLNTTTTRAYALDYSTLSLTAPYLFEVSIDDFVSQYKALFTAGVSNPSAVVAEVITNLKSANPNLKFGATIYEDDLSGAYLQNAKLPAVQRARFDYVHLFIHYREDGPNYAAYVATAKQLFPKAKIVAGSYAYDRRAFLPCSPDGQPCTELQDLDLFEQSLTIQQQEAANGTVDHIEFYPGYFGNEETWPSWTNTRECAAAEIAECIANTKVMREAALGILGGSAAGSWTMLSPGGYVPAGLYGSSAAMDSAHDMMILFGGTGKTFTTNQTWVLAGADGKHGTPQWLGLATANNPPAAPYSNGMFDPASDRFIVYGGVVGRDVWVLTNANGQSSTPPTWSRLNPAGVTPPNFSSWQSDVYDPVNNIMIVYDSSEGVFALSNANGLGGTPVWSQLSVTGTGPSTRSAFTAVYDPGSNRMIVFGGMGGGVEYNDYWVLTDANGLGGTPEWQKLKLGTSTVPAARSGHTAVYDPTENAMTIFGGIGEPPETWTASHANGVGGAPTWTKVNSGASGIESLTYCSVVLNTNSLSMIVFGGYNTTISNSTYVLFPVL